MPEAPVSALVGLARRAEELGYRRCWVYDEGLVTRDVYVTLTAIALATDSIRLGPGITNPYVRHPGATATAIATLDELSGGRAFVGIGAGGGLTLRPLAIEPRKPLTAVRDMVRALRSLFAGDTVDLDGEVFSLKGARLDYGRADIEMILAGRGPRMTALGGEIADGFNLSYIHKALIGDHARSLRAAAGSRPFVITYSTAIAATDDELEAARAGLTFRLVDSPADVKAMLGMTDDDVDSIRAGLARGGTEAAAEFVRPEWVQDFVLSGPEPEVAAELGRLMADGGVDEFQLPVQQIDGAAELIERTAALFNHPEFSPSRNF